MKTEAEEVDRQVGLVAGCVFYIVVTFAMFICSGLTYAALVWVNG